MCFVLFNCVVLVSSGVFCVFVGVVVYVCGLFVFCFFVLLY